ncbi:MAG: GNAT family N-acetyltransferase [Pseudomonadota bacterium]|nr:GNAT family N-acetyltransferase [Pseudomonadota bacterium]
METLVPKDATSDNEIEKCFDVMSELRPHLERSKFLHTVREMESHGFKLAYIEDANTVVAVAGYRIAQNLFLGKHLYIDDIVTSQNIRSKGYGDTLYKWLRKKAQNTGCTHIHLDSAVHRGDTHRFYFRQGLTISSFHFREKLVDL